VPLSNSGGSYPGPGSKLRGWDPPVLGGRAGTRAGVPAPHDFSKGQKEGSPQAAYFLLRTKLLLSRGFLFEARFLPDRPNASPACPSLVARKFRWGLVSRYLLNASEVPLGATILSPFRVALPIMFTPFQ